MTPDATVALTMLGLSLRVLFPEGHGMWLHEQIYPESRPVHTPALTAGVTFNLDLS